MPLQIGRKKVKRILSRILLAVPISGMKEQEVGGSSLGSKGPYSNHLHGIMSSNNFRQQVFKMGHGKGISHLNEESENINQSALQIGD